MRVLVVSLTLTLILGKSACTPAVPLESRDAHLDAPVLVLQYVESVPPGAVSADMLDPWRTDGALVVAVGEAGDAAVLLPAGLSVAEVPGLEGSSTAGAWGIAVPIVVIGSLWLLEQGPFVGVAIDRHWNPERQQQMTALLEQGVESLNDAFAAARANLLLAFLERAGVQIGATQATTYPPAGCNHLVHGEVQGLRSTTSDRTLVPIIVCSTGGVTTANADSILIEGWAWGGRLLELHVWNDGPEPVSVEVDGKALGVVAPGVATSLWPWTDKPFGLVTLGGTYQLNYFFYGRPLQ